MGREYSWLCTCAEDSAGWCAWTREARLAGHSQTDLVAYKVAAAASAQASRPLRTCGLTPCGTVGPATYVRARARHGQQPSAMMAVLEYSSTLYCTCVQSYLRARYSCFLTLVLLPVLLLYCSTIDSTLHFGAWVLLYEPVSFCTTSTVRVLEYSYS